MVVRELHSLWPPAVTEAGSAGVTADLGDVVVSVQNRSSGKLIVRLRKNHDDEAEYAVTLSIPENVLQQTLLSIVRKKGTTLHEVGEIKIFGGDSPIQPSDDPRRHEARACEVEHKRAEIMSLKMAKLVIELYRRINKLSSEQRPADGTNSDSPQKRKRLTDFFPRVDSKEQDAPPPR